jgi:hypothetical protein
MERSSHAHNYRASDHAIERELIRQRQVAFNLSVFSAHSASSNLVSDTKQLPLEQTPRDVT